MRLSAGILWLMIKEQNNEEISTKLGYQQKIDIRSYCRRNNSLLLGLSYELLFKSIIVSKDNKAEIPTTHNLVKLSEICGFQISNDEKSLFSLLSHYIKWAGKYPEPLRKEDNEEYNKIFSNTVVYRFKKDNIFSSVYNGVLDWDKNQELWDRINKVYSDLNN